MRDWINTGKAEDDRRYKIAYLPLHSLINCLAENNRMPDDTIVRVSLDVPEGTVVIERFYSSMRMAECVVLYNPDWPSVPIGYEVPELYTTHKYVQVRLCDPAIRPDADLKTQQNYLTLQQNRMRAEIIDGIEKITGKKVHTVRYDQEKQATRFLGEDGKLLDIIEDTDERLNTVSIVKSQLKFLEFTYGDYKKGSVLCP